ncbi:T9SS type A sorting domain-containing protein [uncultured Psychroserpens sp.]|uniref:T9SS type A sorting domain-containing protein n=1 Tax=uncultured Psychroserpens sp. TaxID=255436 RepID=UPI00262F8100|nr:T9SS type A sorting domain-containing protein [uncultured Psychroserpens sp.]
MRKFNLFIVLLISFNTFSQNVDTLVNNSTFTMNHGCVIGDDGSIYSTDLLGNGSFNGDNIYKTLPDGTTTLFASGISGASGLAIDSSGNLYVSELNFGRVWKILPDGTASIYTSGMGVPAGLAFDSQGNLFVASFQNDLIIKVEPNGNASIFANTPDEPVGIIIDENDNLYVSHESSHVINKITPNGIQTEFVNIPNTKFQYLTFFGDDILVTGSIDHKIYHITSDGTYTVFAGSGVQGNMDGDINLASFDNPTGIGISPDGLTLYIVELNRIRTIDNLNLSIDNSKKELFKIFPNPINENYVQINFDNTFDGVFKLFSVTGQELIKIELSNETNLKLDFANLSSGIFFYKLQGFKDNNTYTGKLIKQ